MLQEKWGENRVSNHGKIYHFFQKMILDPKFFRMLKTAKSVKRVKLRVFGRHLLRSNCFLCWNLNIKIGGKIKKLGDKLPIDKLLFIELAQTFLNKSCSNDFMSIYAKLRRLFNFYFVFWILDQFLSKAVVI